MSAALLSALCCCRGLTAGRCCWNPCLNLKAANQPNSYCHSYLKSQRSQPFLLSVQKVGRITLVTLILVKRENVTVLASTPVLFSSAFYSFSFPPSLPPSHQLSPPRMPSALNPFFPIIAPIYICTSVLCYFLWTLFLHQEPEERINNDGYTFLLLLYAFSQSTQTLLPCMLR